MVRNLLFAGLFSVMVGAAGAATLESLQWRYRVIAVFAPDAATGRNAADTLAQADGLDERDIAWFVATPDAIQSRPTLTLDRASLRALRQADGQPDGFEAVLVGKDGSVKLRQTGQLDLAALFTAIDRMPMRQQEMRER